MDNSDNQGQFRLFAAVILSMLILGVWSYLNPPAPPPEPTQTETAANQQATPQPTEAPAAPAATPAPQVDEAPNRQIVVKSPLYQVTLDSRGAVASSWILLKNKINGRETPLFADGSTPENPKPLELISNEARSRMPRELPFRLATGDAALDTLLNERNYQVNAEGDTVTLNAGEEKTIEFTLTDGAGLEARKRFLFRADGYIADLGLEVKRNGQTVPNTKLLIGPSIGDHAINNHTFYRIESEAVASVGGDIYRKQGYYSFEYDAQNQGSLTVPGAVSWAGVGDAYFAMAAIPSAPADGLEVRASKYDVETAPFYPSIFSWAIRSPQTKETRHLVTAYVPVAADGSVTRIYTGTKDYFHLSSISNDLDTSAGRELEFVNIINFASYRIVRFFVKPLSIPILYALDFFNRLTGNYGIAIIVFTFLFYSLLFPLRWSQSKSFKKAAGNAPKMKEVQDKIKDLQKKGVPMDDPRMRELQMEQLRMMKGAVPIGGCLPMLLQFPLLIAFYTAITIALDARQASFAWLPDLSGADPWHILEFGFAISMVLAMKFTPTGAAVTPEQQMQQKMMTWLMPVMMLWVMWTAPSGLLLYWFFGNIVSFGQQMVINYMNKPAEPETTEVVNEPLPKNIKKVKGGKKDK